MKQLELGIGDTITVYKANMIIPQIAENITKSNGISIPDTCPVCGGKTEIRKLNEVEALYCTNGECDAKKIKSFTHFVGRNALNIDGLSEATLEKMIAMGFIHEYADIFHLSQHRDSIVLMEGFGEKSYQNLVRSIEAARKTSLPAFLYSLGIPNVGVANAKMICKEFQYDLDSIRNAGLEDLASIDGIGEVIAKRIVDYFIEESNAIKIDHLLSEIEFEAVIVNANANVLEGITFVITGSLERFENRDSLKEIIENMGGKVTGSVTKKTSYLINNDNLSTSSKNKKAKELGIPIITEEEFIEQFQ